jgi:hypothetical protein
MDHEDMAIERHPELVKGWLKSRDRGWKIAMELSEELQNIRLQAEINRRKMQED